MRNQLVAALAATAVMMTIGGTASAAHATDGDSGNDQCVPSAGSDDVFGAWAQSRQGTAWTTDPTSAPADPDGDDDPASLSNTQRYVRESRPVDGTQGSYTAWAQTGVTQVQHGDPTPPGVDTDVLQYRGPATSQDVTQAYVPAVAATPDVWANFSPNKDQQTFIGPPVWPNDSRGTWQVHNQLPPGQAGPDGVYFNGNAHKGGDWFYRHAGTPAVPAIPENSHTDYVWTIWQRDLIPGAPGSTEYRWSLETRTNTAGTSPVTCEATGGDTGNGGGGNGGGGNGGGDTGNPGDTGNGNPGNPGDKGGTPDDGGTPSHEGTTGHEGTDGSTGGPADQPGSTLPAGTPNAAPRPHHVTGSLPQHGAGHGAALPTSIDAGL